MGSYFSKTKQIKNIPFEALERSVETLNPNQYPTFEHSSEWAKTRHVYSQQICFQEKYISWSIILVLFLILLSFLYLNYSKTVPALDIPIENNDINL
jgi:hypothetical protein